MSAKTGAYALLRSAADAGYDLCLANPGTTEMEFCAALDTVPEIRPVLCLFEGVCTGAADTYARVSGRPALVLLHLAPGLANGLANLHNARRAHSPMVILVGEHTQAQRPLDPPLAGEIEALATAISPSAWVRTSKRAADLAADFCAADRAAREGPGRLAFLVVPADAQWGDPEASAPRDAIDTKRPPVDAARVRDMAECLHRGGDQGLWLGGSTLREAGLLQAARIQAATGCRLLTGSFPGFTARGPALPSVERLPYFPEAAMQSVATLERIIRVEAEEPVTFFGYQNVPGRVLPDACERHLLAALDENGSEYLEALADELGAPTSVSQPTRERAELPSGALDARTFSQTMAALHPEGAIVMDEALTSATGYWELAAGSPRYDHLCLTGGAIGMGLPGATGAALAAPDRPVLSLQADGSAMYTLQALWTQAREGLNITTVLCSNQSYRILEIERKRFGMEAGPSSAGFTELDRPVIDWCALARGMGVESERVLDAEGLAKAVRRSLASPGPQLIEARIV